MGNEFTREGRLSVQGGGLTMRWSRGLEVRFIRADARGLPSQAGWPLAWLELDGREARAKLFGDTATIPSGTSVLVTQPSAQFGKSSPRIQLHFDLAGADGLASIEVLIRDSGRAEEVLAALREAGFDIATGSTDN